MSPSSADFVAELRSVVGDAYTIEREIPGGGMSRLFLATERSLGRAVVIKLLPPDMASAVSAARFRREMDLAAHLQHPHILPILSAGSGDRLLYYIMPYVTGESLRHRLQRETRLPVADASRILREVADALAFAHSRGVVHRDIKPENILLEQGHAVLTDFGIARALQERSAGLTGTGLSIGTSGYMAPEQVAGDDVDGRTDLYALAAVGFEMLAGRPPFVGPSAEVLAAHLRDTPPPVDTLRPDTPAALSDAIARGLAKSPGDRFPGAGDFRDALETSGDRRPLTSGRMRFRRRWAIAAAALVVVAIVAAVLVRGARRGSADTNLIAVAPFEVLSPSLALWREGMVDVLSRNLDGAGALRTVAPSVVVNKWSGRADKLSATALAQRTGARYAVFGSLQPVGGDSVRATATVVDGSSGQSLGDVEQRDAVSRMDHVADGLTLRILERLGRPKGEVRPGAIGSKSLLAIKSFLQGEQFFRRTSWDSAVAHYDQAIANDSNFALAYSRLGTAAGWQRGAGDRDARSYQLRAGSLNHGLAPRESLLVLADSLGAALTYGPADSSSWQHRRRLFSTLEEASRRYPDDPQVWYSLGDARFHWAVGPGLRVTNAQILEAFDRSIAADSTFAPAYIHPVELGFEMEGAAAAMRYARAYLAQNPTDVSADAIRGAVALVEASRSRDGIAALDSLPLATLGRAGPYVRGWADSGEVLLQLIRRRSASSSAPRQPAESAPSLAGPLLNELTFRGHVAEAMKRPLMRRSQLAVGIAFLGGMAKDSADVLAAEWGRERSDLYFSALPWLASRGDTATLSRHITNARAELPRATNPIAKRLSPFIIATIETYLALAKHDTSDALRRFAALPDSLCPDCFYTDQLIRAKLLASHGRDRDALALLTARRSNLEGTSASVLFAIEAGPVAERLGERQIAIDAYSRVVDAWLHADAALQPYVAQARNGLKRLTGDMTVRERVAGGRGRAAPTRTPQSPPR
ncbi:MAG: protein kinase domain-containing protein [Gemmatimonadaceae bacterium]